LLRPSNLICFVLAACQTPHCALMRIGGCETPLCRHGNASAPNHHRTDVSDSAGVDRALVKCRTPFIDYMLYIMQLGYRSVKCGILWQTERDCRRSDDFTMTSDPSTAHHFASRQCTRSTRTHLFTPSLALIIKGRSSSRSSIASAAIFAVQYVGPTTRVAVTCGARRWWRRRRLRLNRETMERAGTQYLGRPSKGRTKYF